MFDSKGRFIMEDYDVKSTFASFLPGISGKMGIPIWSFYVNRGQAVCSFGSEDKEHSIMEFYPAHQSYQLTGTHGFRTFIKSNGKYYEAFSDINNKKAMFIGMNELAIEETNNESGVKTEVLYFTLPTEDVGALVRTVKFTNVSDSEISLDVLDGMPAIITYGTEVSAIKTMGQTSKAWMQVEDVEKAMPYYRVRVSTADSAIVTQVLGGNFYICEDAAGERLPVIVDPDVIFEHDTAMHRAFGFDKKSLEELFNTKQVKQNKLPCAFFGKSMTLKPGESFTIYGVIGQVAKKEILESFAKRCAAPGYFEKKYEEAINLTKDLCKVIRTKSADPVFDAYCEQTYLDNLLRGGFPVELGNKIFYVYSRKHGDIERDYNFFRMLPEFYSQGNANFRDVNQNRRCDTLFTPFVKDVNIKMFYNLIQLDGCNPLSVLMTSYYMTDDEAECLKAYVPADKWEDVKKVLTKAFTPGQLLGYIHNNNIELTIGLEEFLNKAVSNAESSVNADFGEGYWSDHWTYNLDLVETYLAVYPDDEERLIYGDRTYTYFESKAAVLPRSKRYVNTPNGVRQYRSIDEAPKKGVDFKIARTSYGKGSEIKSNLMEKLVSLTISKFAALDSYGMGIEMEGGKPGWYDALNGLPGIFGSSMCESYELCRMMEFIDAVNDKYKKDIALPFEMVNYLRDINEALGKYNAGEISQFDFWNAANNAKESYREITMYGVDGREEIISAAKLSEVIKSWIAYSKAGIDRAVEYGNGISPAYFTYRLTEFDMDGETVLPKKFEVDMMPHFLEGPVRYLKLKNSFETKEAMYDKIKNSTLYDDKLSMYKVDESLEKASFEVGRAKAFTPGWLENESIWLHMEYKYLLEVLKSGLYEDYYDDLKKACVAFLDPAVYGRSPLENSSFIASSANPDESIHGKGFVARLSGSTAEFIQMWYIMMFGKTPFTMENGSLALTLDPAIPAYLLDEDNSITATLLGAIDVTYKADAKKNIIPGKSSIVSMKVKYADGSEKQFEGSRLYGEDAQAVRDLKVESIEAVIK